MEEKKKKELRKALEELNKNYVGITVTHFSNDEVIGYEKILRALVIHSHDERCSKYYKHYLKRLHKEMVRLKEIRGIENVL